MTFTSIQVAIVIKSRIYREGIAQHFETQSDIVLSGMHSTATQLIPCLPKRSMDVIVLECITGGLHSLVQRIKGGNRHAKIIIMMHDQDIDLVRECIAAGVEGFVTSNDGMDDLYSCIMNVHSGRISYPADMCKQAIHEAATQPKPDQCIFKIKIMLTARQLTVIELLESGFSNKEIARQLGIELATVKNHVHQILERLNVKNRCEAAARFRKLKIESRTADTNDGSLIYPSNRRSALPLVKLHS